jgi:Flp pilus assembly pilin Flp
MSNVLVKLYLAAASLDLRERLRREDGQAVTEYALIIGLLVVGAIALLTTIGGGIVKNLTDLSNTLKP